MTSSTENPLLTEYRKEQYLYTEFAATLAALLRRILAEHSIPLHSVTQRVKDPTSLARKLNRPDRSYVGLADLTDLAGVRVTTYFHDHVDAIASIIESEFMIDRANSVDTRTLLDPDRFGYASLHYVVELSPRRLELSEYQRFQGLKAEIQLRTLLQHVWAEIEHDLGYKSSRSVPRQIRRRFARLAGMLELADAEFLDIREELSAYEKEVVARIELEPATVPLDKASLVAFVRGSDVVNALDTLLASNVETSTVPAEVSDIDRYLAHLNFVGISTVGKLDTALREHEDAIKRFGQAWMTGSHSGKFTEGITLFYLTYVLLAKRRDQSQIIEWANEMHVGNKLLRPQLADKVLTVGATVGL